jgi:hypothetical protein
LDFCISGGGDGHSILEPNRWRRRGERKGREKNHDGSTFLLFKLINPHARGENSFYSF